MTSPKPLTRAQQLVLEYVRTYRREQMGVSPTFTEIGKGLGMSKVTVHEHVEALKKKGWVTADKHKSRSVVPVEAEPWREGVEKLVKRLSELSLWLRTYGDMPGVNRMVESILADAKKLLEGK